MIRRSIGLGIISTSVAMVLCAIPTRAQMSPAVMATVQESAPIPADQIPPADKNAVASPDRPAEDVKLDAGRKPDQMLAFFGIAPGMQVADLFAGGGYTTELLSRAVGPTGKVYSQNIPFPPKVQKGWRDVGRAAQKTRVEQCRAGSKTIRRTRFAAGAAGLARRGRYEHELSRPGAVQVRPSQCQCGGVQGAQAGRLL